jgi:hypothetical protein
MLHDFLIWMVSNQNHQMMDTPKRPKLDCQAYTYIPKIFAYQISRQAKGYGNNPPIYRLPNCKNHMGSLSMAY